MSPETIHQFSRTLLHIMQFSIVVPMVIVWRRRQHFPAAIKLLSWYVYLSAFFSLAVDLSAKYLHNNEIFLIGFNTGKILLFASVYSRAMPGRQRFFQWSTIAVCVIIMLTMSYDMSLAVDMARVLQCALLAGFAMLYVDFHLNESGSITSFQNPMWLLSVGQLVYSAGTVTSFSFDIIFMKAGVPPLYSDMLTVFLAFSGLAFNTFLVLAFLRARQQERQPQVGTNKTHPFTKVTVG